MKALSVHGGRLSDARALFPAAPQPWIDLSTGISPWPYPAGFASPAERSRLPDRHAIAALEAAAAAAFGLPPSSVLAVPGAEAGIRLLALVLKAERVAVVEPTYGGHRSAWMAAGAHVDAIQRTDVAAALETFGAVIVVNPNNPDGASGALDAAISAAGSARSGKGWLIVDEAFVDHDPALSVTHGLGSGRPGGLITLRSFGKFYGLPGVRLGFLTAAPQTIVRLRAGLGEWPVSADAIAAGIQAYQDGPWAAKTRRRLLKASRRLDRMLTGAGFVVVGGTPLFRLVAAADAAARFRRLAERGVLTRPFADAASWLRFGLPPTPHWKRLKAALMETAL